MNAPAKEATPTTPGTPFAGGIYAGRLFVGDVAYALVVAPRAEGEHDETKWSKNTKSVTGAESYYDGRANTDAMAEAGSAIATWAKGLSIGGFDDWYLPSRGEALLIKSVELPEAEALERDVYWTSTQLADDPACAWCQLFFWGSQLSWLKASKVRARAVRRVPI